MPRIMIINWKFENKDEASGNKKEYKIVDYKNDKLICCNYNSTKLNDLKKLCNKNNGNKFLLLLHINPPNQIFKKDLKLVNGSLKIFEFKGGGKQVYYSANGRPLGLLSGTNLDRNSKNNSGKIKKEHFDFVWNSYYSKETIDKLINLFFLLDDGQKMNSKDLKNEADENLFGNIREKTLNFFDDVSEENNNDFKNGIRIYIPESD